MRHGRIAVDASRANTAARTGIEWYSVEVITALARIHDRPSLVLYDRHGANFAPLSPADERRAVGLPRLWTHVGLSAAMIRDRPDALFVPSHVIPAIHPRASVVTIHDLGYRFEPDAHPKRARSMLEISTRWNARMARHIIAISGQTRDDLVSEYGVVRSKISVIHSGVNHSRFRPVDPGPYLRSQNLRQPYVLFLSTVQPRKNLSRLVEAFEAINRADLSLVVAGKSGWLTDEIDARIANSPARQRIVRLGHVPDEHVPALYCGAAVFAMPSLYEGFGFGILEAMACGCPVVTSDRSSMPEVAGDAAILVNPIDVAAIRSGIERALVPQEAARITAAGLLRAAEFAWDETARNTLSVIESAMRP
jgi:glycosyltransferase involved in cell wall biosynthesis